MLYSEELGIHITISVGTGIVDLRQHRNVSEKSICKALNAEQC